jgi:hypothetical protein
MGHANKFGTATPGVQIQARDRLSNTNSAVSFAGGDGGGAVRTREGHRFPAEGFEGGAATIGPWIVILA